MVPREFRSAWVVVSDVPYRLHDDRMDDTALTNRQATVEEVQIREAKGVLHPGRVVWAKRAPGSGLSEQMVPVYVDGIGVVSLERCSIAPSRS